MSLERSQLIEFLRGELVGPVRSAAVENGRLRFEVKGSGEVEPHPQQGCFNAWLYWKPEGPEGNEEEILSIRDGNNPHRAYGVGILHPAGVRDAPEDVPSEESHEGDGQQATGGGAVVEEVESIGAADADEDRSTAPDNDIEIISPDANRPSSMAISFCVTLEQAGELVVSLPRSRRLKWQEEGQDEFSLNGFYERFHLRLERREGQDQDPLVTAWRRRPAVSNGAAVRFSKELLTGDATVQQRTIAVPKAPGIPEGFKLNIQVYPRKRTDGSLLVTVVLRNQSSGDLRAMALFQSQFEVRANSGSFLPYPESERPFQDLDKDEQAMELLYRNTRCWAIGHGCAAGWNDSDGERPTVLTADVLPAVELPSMTPDIELNGRPLTISMSVLAALPDHYASDVEAWHGLDALIDGYTRWIEQRQTIAQETLPEHLREVANRHLEVCRRALERMNAGVGLLRNDGLVRQAFRWANEAMLLQQISLKQIKRRELAWDKQEREAVPLGERTDPFVIRECNEVAAGLGNWRAFQIAFLLLSLRGMVEPDSDDRELVDLVWFPTGGGKTEAYLGVAAFQMFHQRMLIPEQAENAPRRDGTNVLMRYTLRMLTTDQFQRAASLICGMEAIRQREADQIKGDPFRLGLWLGGAGSPNKVEDAQFEIGRYANEKANAGNPLVLTDCPWCRAAIGRLDVDRPPNVRAGDWAIRRLGGIRKSDATMRCPDPGCLFGGIDNQLPVEVIDERIYQVRPSMVIGTADKFAMLAYKTEAGSLFGRARHNIDVIQTHRPPSLIIQDELHLISGPLGTLFGLYETIFNDLCTIGGCQPKIISSTATVRGADQQVQALFAREKTALFPPPGLDISDSFFGRYARRSDGALESGRLYVGIHALYGSLQTTQARTFAAVLARSTTFDDKQKDPWWTLLAYYNSIRELSGARTLFDSDIQSRLQHLAGREGMRVRHLVLDELSSRLSQAQIVALKDRLAKRIENGFEGDRVDACLSSNIIEVGVDIDRLSLMAVVGQPKSTASYIQASGRVGRRWWERPGLILTLLNPRKSRDSSHFEQFHTYHRRLYERVEPTSVTPFSISALERGLVGAVLAHVRQHVACNNPDRPEVFQEALARTAELFRYRRGAIGMEGGDRVRSGSEFERLFKMLIDRWEFFRPTYWNSWNQPPDVFPLMLVPGKFANGDQKRRGFEVPTSLRQVDAQAELSIDYFEQDFPR